MRNISQHIGTGRRRHRRATGRFFLFLAITLLVVAGIFLLYRAFPFEISKAADGEMAPAEGEAQTLKQIIPADGGIKVIVDPGHGDTDVGTKGVSTGRLEKEVNLEIALKLKAVLEGKGYTVIMTRESDEPIAAADEPDAKVRKAADMAKREEIIRTANADVFVSIHQNFFEQGSGAAGPQVFYRDREAPGYRLAQYVQSALNEQLDIANPRDVNSGDYQLLRPGSQASIIVECGFFSNPEEEQKLQKDDYQEAIARAVGSGIETYLSENNL
ncbi:N-acetylmuramoyl-L-alanine amidase [Christensenella intestinihominis]|uniref:N-acetylmuramoyl-L-alanine amidase n=1 Tax=Christensenella intestinihominis TaxID=1851429 RepID=UPI0009F44FAD|nr:N-acetylmuramoyl-L-alanine amidase [Christensenella intestinihominis]